MTPPTPAQLQIGYIDPLLGPLTLGALCWSETVALQQTWVHWPAMAGSPWLVRLLDTQGHVLEERRIERAVLEALVCERILAERLATARLAARFYH